MTEDVYGVNKRGYHHGDLRRTGLEAAIGILETEGLEKLSLRAVASRTGVSPMALYRHFADKSALLAAIGQHGFGLLRERLLEAAGDGSVQEVLTAWGVAYVLFAHGHPDLFRLMFGQPPSWQGPGERAALPERLDTPFGMLTAIMRGAFPPEEVDMAVLTAWSFVHGLAALVVDRRLNPFPPEVERLIGEVSRFFAGRMAPAS